MRHLLTFEIEYLDNYFSGFKVLTISEIELYNKYHRKLNTEEVLTINPWGIVEFDISGQEFLNYFNLVEITDQQYTDLVFMFRYDLFGFNPICLLDDIINNV